MRASALALGLALLGAAAPHHRRALQPNLQKSGPVSAAAAALPTFEFLKNGVSGAEECAGSALTGSLGETITYTRASSQTCTKSTGVLVVLSANQPALEGNGLHVEATSTNLALRSDAIDNAIWTLSGGGGSAVPVVTANTADVTDPLGTNTAEKVAFPAVSAGGAFSIVNQTITLSVATHVGSIYFRTLSGTATIYVGIDNGGTRLGTAACSVTTSWTRCSTVPGTPTAAAWVFRFGVNLNDVAHSAQPAQTVYAWGGQVELFNFASSYIATAGTAVTRAVTNVALPNLTLSTTPSMAMTVYRNGITSGAYWGMLGVSAADNLHAYTTGAGGLPGCQYGAGTSKAHSVAIPISASTRIACYYDGTNLGICNALACETGAASVAITAATTANALGYLRPSTSSYQNGWIKAVCIDSTSGGCR